MERLTWNEIVSKYPDKWVGLTEVEWNGADVKSAIVSYVRNNKSELIKLQLMGKGVYTIYTTPENLPDDIGLICEVKNQ